MEFVICSAQDITEQKRVENFQKVLFGITKAAITTKTLKELVEEIERSLATVIETSNMKIAVFDKDGISFAIINDKENKEGKRYDLSKNPLIKHVISQGNPHTLTERDIVKLYKSNRFNFMESLPKAWMGIPLRVSNKTIGIIVFQNYLTNENLPQQYIRFLDSASQSIALAIEHIQIQTEIGESNDKNKMLLGEIHHRVKNNLAIISSLLSIHADFLGDDKINEIFLVVQGRIRSMLVMHENCMKPKTLKTLILKLI